MKKNIIIGILIAIILMGFTGVESGLITFKPAMPKQTASVTLTQNKIAPWILQKAKEGYVVKFMISNGDGSTIFNAVTVVMEKY